MELSKKQRAFLLSIRDYSKFFDGVLDAGDRNLIIRTIDNNKYNFITQGFLNDIRDKYVEYKKRTGIKIINDGTYYTEL